MDERDFAYWLRGALELGGLKTLNEEQVAMVSAHLDLVMAPVACVEPVQGPGVEPGVQEVEAAPVVELHAPSRPAGDSVETKPRITAEVLRQVVEESDARAGNAYRDRLRRVLQGSDCGGCLVHRRLC